jgi:hypothetical protein
LLPSRKSLGSPNRIARQVEADDVQVTTSPIVSPASLVEVREEKAAISPSEVAPKSKVAKPGRTPPPTNTPRRSINRSDGRHLTKVSVYLDVGLAKKLRMQSAADDIDMSTIVGDALERYFSK